MDDQAQFIVKLVVVDDDVSVIKAVAKGSFGSIIGFEHESNRSEVPDYVFNMVFADLEENGGIGSLNEQFAKFTAA